jgi:hypothetical protein
VVIVGIFLGMQVTEWNEQNKLNAQEGVLRANLEEAVIDAGRLADTFTAAEKSNIEILDNLLKNWNSQSYSDVKGVFRPFQDENFSPIFNLTSYSQFYDPNTDVYDTAVNDGSISIIQDEQFLYRLNFLYNYVVPRVNELMKEEYVLSQSINEHIAKRYEHIFLENDVSDSITNTSSLWSEATYEQLFIEMRKDGVLKYKLAHRLELKRSRLLIIGQAKRLIEALSSGSKQ